jgi:hypothetical protein
MDVKMTEQTFNLIGQMLMSDINVPLKQVAAYAQAQGEWKAAVDEANNAASQQEFIPATPGQS